MGRVRWWAVVSAGLPPVSPVGGWTLAARRQPPGYDRVRDTVSALAGTAATDRWVMTVVLASLLGWFGAELFADVAVAGTCRLVSPA